MGIFFSKGGRTDGKSRGAPQKDLPHPHGGYRITTMASAGPGRILTGASDCIVKLWDFPSGGTRMHWCAHDKPVLRACHLENAERVMSCGRDRRVRLWEPGSQSPVRQVEGAHDMAITGLAVNEESNMALTGSRDGIVKSWDLAALQCTSKRETDRNVVTSMKWIPGEQAIVQSSEDLTLKIWDARLMGVVQEMKGGSQIFLDCDAAPDGLHVAGCSHGFDGDGCDAQVFDRRSAKQISHLRGHESSVATCCFLPGESVEPRPGFLATGSKDETVRVWSINEGESVAEAKVLPGTSVSAVTRLVEADDNEECLGASGFTGDVALWRFLPRLRTLRCIASTERTNDGDEAREHPIR